MTTSDRSNGDGQAGRLHQEERSKSRSRRLSRATEARRLLPSLPALPRGRKDKNGGGSSLLMRRLGARRKSSAG